jgi:hypothetical protein
MPIKLDVKVDESLKADLDATLEDLAEAAMAAADAVSEWGKKELRDDTRAALGPKVANAWRSRVYPRRGASLNPAITWWSNAPHIVRAFSEGATIQSDSGFWLAIPTENAPQAGRSFGSSGRLRRARKHAITEAERRFGRLRYIQIPGRKLALLVADKVRKRRGKRGGFAQASPAALKRGDFEDGVVMFVLVPQVRLKKRIDPQSVAEAIGREGLARFSAAFDDITRRRFGGT